MIPNHLIEEIRNKTDIVQVISEYVQLKKRGKNYLGLCPFHSEKDASFTVSPDKQIFHCFGCNEGGNAFAFLMKIENINFVEAVEELSIKTNVQIPKVGRHGPSKSDKDKLYQVMVMASKFFEEQLSAPSGKVAADYFSNRNISEKTREQFKLGFAPPGWDNLFNYLIARGVGPEIIEKTGLILSRENKSGYYDRFRNRIIFTICDQRGRVLAFGGRSLGDEEPKYLNSSDTPIYQKGETLYGLNLSKDSIKKKRTAIMVEGYFDLVTPYQSGITNMVATLGTALTTAQCKLLSRYCDTVILGFDADTAGGIAAERSIELLKNQGIKVKVAKLEGGKDPDEIISKQGKEGFIKCLDSSLPYLEFKTNRIFGRYNLKEIESRASAFKDVASLLSQEKDPFVQKEYAKLIAPHLKTDIDSILTEINRIKQYQGKGQKNLRRKTEKPGSKLAEAEKSLIAFASQDKKILETVKEQTSLEDFSIPETRAIAEVLFSTEFKEDNPSHFLLNNLPKEETTKFLSKLLMQQHLALNENNSAVVKDCLKVIEQHRQENKIDNLKEQIKEAEKAGKNDEVVKLLSLIKSEIS
jgi:DNA primase